jgi:hypothetical protein
MGAPELKALWDAGGPWTDKLDEWAEEREAALPRLHEIVGRLVDGRSTAAEFRSEMDSFGKQTKYGGFHGSGQMFLNILVKADADDTVATALRDAVKAPQDAHECQQKLTAFLAFVDEARESAKDRGVALPGHGYAPYLLSFFWEAEDREEWPIYYPRSRATLAAHGLFKEAGSLADRYLSYRAQVLQLREELGTDTWGVESLLWHLRDGAGPGPGPGPGPGLESGDLYESYLGQGLFFPDEVVTSLVLSLLTKPFVLLTGISGTGKTQIAVGLAEYLDQRVGGGVVELKAPEGDDSNVYIRLTASRLRLGRSYLTREHQATFALHGIPDRGSARDYEITLPDGTHAELRLNNIGFADPTRELYLLFFRSTAKEWLQANAHDGDFLHLRFDDDGEIVAFAVVQPERRESDIPARRHQVIAVRSDWTDPRGLIGYENPLTGTYTKTDVITLLLQAQADPERPYVVILDEMNLARVEYYFSDFLSAMELHGGTISLRESNAIDSVGDEGDGDVPARLPFPPNVLVIGTVNIDETTHAFSPKVLDRANVIVFNDVDVQQFLGEAGESAASTFRLARAELDPTVLADREARNVAALATGRNAVAFTEPLVQLHELLRSFDLHFGYRVLKEMTTFAGLALELVAGDEDETARTAFDLQLVQKVLPKINGGRELELPLSHLLAFCLDGTPRKAVDSAAVLSEARDRLAMVLPVVEHEQTPAEPEPDEESSKLEEPDVVAPTPPVYARATRELVRMLDRLRTNGFVSFLE